MDTATLHFYLREGLPRHAQAVCEDAVQDSTDAASLAQLWRAHALLVQGSSMQVGLLRRPGHTQGGGA